MNPSRPAEWLATSVSLVKLVQDEAQRIPLGKVKDRAQVILESLFRDSALKVKRTWAGDTAGDQDDQACLVLLHWDELKVEDPTDAAPARVQELWEKTPSGGNRAYRNRLVILAPYGPTHEAMLTTVRNYMALESLWKNVELRTGLSRENQEDLRQRASISELEAKVAVCNHMSVLYVPQQQGLLGYQLDIVTQASLKPNQTDPV